MSTGVAQSDPKTKKIAHADESEGMGRQRIYVLAIFLFALAIRVAYVLTLGDTIHWPDEREYHGIAVNLINGKGYSYFRDYGSSVLGPTAYRLPALPAVLALLYKLTGPNLLAARLLQSLMGALLIPIAYSITRELHHSPRPAILACCLLSVYPYYVFCAGAVYPVVLPTLLIGIATLLLLRGRHRGDIRMEAAAGLAIGAGALAMGHLLGAVPFVIVWIVLNKNASLRTRSAASVAMCLAILLVVMPWIIRNKIVMGRGSMSTAFAYNLYVGNRPEATWNSGSRVMELEPPEIKAQAAKMREGEADALYMQLGRKEIRAEPGRFLRLSLGRALNFWRLYPNPAARSVGLAQKLIGSVSYGPALLVSMIWLMLERKRRRVDSLLALFPIGAMLIAALTVSVDRYRLPFDFQLVTLASIAVITWSDRVRRRGENDLKSV